LVEVHARLSRRTDLGTQGIELDVAEFFEVGLGTVVMLVSAVGIVSMADVVN
jgi:hypothetical protein